jgi:drug/metabolite transporter (DMT)-like permease
MSAFLLLANPILTGFAFLVWSKAACSNPLIGPLLNVASGATAAVIIAVLAPGGMPAINTHTVYLWSAYVVVNTLVNITLAYSVGLASGTVVAVLEISYPLFTMLFAIALFGEAGLTKVQMIGAALLIVGTVLVVMPPRS